MFPFDRLIAAMDQWAAAGGGTVLAQIGDGRFEPKHMEFVRRLDQAEFGRTVAAADLVVAHAGMGTVITAGRAGRPLVLMPRSSQRGEHTTDHQMATAGWLRGKPGIFVADDEAGLPAAVEAAMRAGMDTDRRVSAVAETAFTDRLRAAILKP